MGGLVTVNATDRKNNCMRIRTKSGPSQRKMVGFAAGKPKINSEPVMQNNPESLEQHIVSGLTGNNKVCRIIDNTRSVDRILLEQLLQELIADKQFGLHGLSSADGNIKLNEPRFTHIQLGENLYRLLIFSHEAHIEKF